MHNENSNDKYTTVYALESFIESSENNKLYTQKCVKYIYITPLLNSQFRIKFVDIMYLNRNELQKHDDFLRKLSYRYDNIVLSTDSEGVLTSIHNHKEICEQWEKLKSLISQDYTGDDMEQVLKQITKELESPENTIKELSLYNWLGLIFSSPRYIQQAYNKEKVNHYPVRTLHGIFNIQEDITETERTKESTFYKITGRPDINGNEDYNLIEYDGELEIQNTTNKIMEANLDITLKVKDTIRKEQYELYHIDMP